MVKQFEGFEVPIEPKKKWKDWMCDPSEPCPLGRKDCPKPGLLCRRCIYSYLSAVPRKAFYEHCFPDNPETLPKRDSKGRFCKKENGKKETKDQEDWHYGWKFIPNEGLEYSSTGWLILPSSAYPVKVQYYSEQELVGKAVTHIAWGDHHLVSKVRTFPNHETIVYLRQPDGKEESIDMPHFIMSYRFTDTEDYCCRWEREVKEPLPKLTAEVFDRKDCPEWAQWAAVNADGKAFFYDNKPVAGYVTWWDNLAGVDATRIDRTAFDASNWWESLIERPKKLPDYNDWQVWEVRVSPSTHRVIRKAPGYGPTKVRFEEKGNSAVFTVEPEDLPRDLVPVKITLLPPEELIGKTVVDLLGNYTTVIGISENKDRIYVYNIDRGKIENLPLKFFFFEYRLPNGLYVASIEKA